MCLLFSLSSLRFLLTSKTDTNKASKICKTSIYSYHISSYTIYVHCKCFDHKNYGDWKLRGPCMENLHYLWKRNVRIAGKPRDNYRSCNYHGVSPQFLQPFSIDNAGFPCRDPAIPSPRSFYGVKICSAVL